MRPREAIAIYEEQEAGSATGTIVGLAAVRSRATRLLTERSPCLLFTRPLAEQSHWVRLKQRKKSDPQKP